PPSPRWQARAKGRQLAVSPAHEDFAALLAEALDTLAACDWDVGVAAKRLNVTASQLVKLLQREPPALGQLNDQRRLRQLVPLK
ncbi:MAG TPA: hypothetical protein VFV87_14475, partial [Pirellulaceae bacterium]|nr:hypothetical protein [Pirellulaceae bacterium]